MYTGRTCGAVWSYERYVDYELRGFVRDTHRVGNLNTSSSLLARTYDPLSSSYSGAWVKIRRRTLSLYVACFGCIPASPLANIGKPFTCHTERRRLRERKGSHHYDRSC
jgi:hypothetical protein